MIQSRLTIWETLREKVIFWLETLTYESLVSGVILVMTLSLFVFFVSYALLAIVNG